MIILTPDHVYAATVHERALILDWLRDIGLDPHTVRHIRLDDDLVIVEVIELDEAGAVVFDEVDGERELRLRDVVLSAGPTCPRATIHALWGRLDSDDEPTAPDDSDYVDRPALGRTYPYGTGAV